MPPFKNLERTGLSTTSRINKAAAIKEIKPAGKVSKGMSKEIKPHTKTTVKQTALGKSGLTMPLKSSIMA